jgi:aspartate/methionine/tyrosine aminotransferase
MSLLYGGQITPGDISITEGCNQAFVVAIMALARAGDAVILPAPWYFNHQMTLQMLGIEARVLDTLPESGFLPDLAGAAALIDEHVRAIVLVTPNNPTGAVYPPSLIADFAALAREAGIALIIDETYRDFLPDGVDAPHKLFAGSTWRDTVVHLYSFSKAYAVPGWRLGALVAGETVQAQIGKVLDSLQICPARPGQAAVAWGIGALGGWRAENRATINARATAFRRAMSALNGWSVDQAGAYFAYVRHPFDGVRAADVAEMLGRAGAARALLRAGPGAASAHGVREC